MRGPRVHGESCRHRIGKADSVWSRPASSVVAKRAMNGGDFWDSTHRAGEGATSSLFTKPGMPEGLERGASSRPRNSRSCGETHSSLVGHGPLDSSPLVCPMRPRGLLVGLAWSARSGALSVVTLPGMSRRVDESAGPSMLGTSERESGRRGVDGFECLLGHVSCAALGWPL